MKTSVKKVTVNLPADLLDEARLVTKKGITPTLIEALEELRKREQRSALRRLKGKVKFELDLPRTRR